MLSTLFYGIYNFPFYYGGFVWNYFYNNNSTDTKPLYYLIQTIYSSKAFFSIGVGAFLDPEMRPFHIKEVKEEKPGDNEPIYEQKVKVKRNLFSFKNIFSFYKKYKRHFVLCK